MAIEGSIPEVTEVCFVALVPKCLDPDGDSVVAGSISVTVSHVTARL